MSPGLGSVPEDAVPVYKPPVLAATRASLPLRRVKSLPPYGPGPTEMYVLPSNMKPSRPRSTRNPSVKKRWRPSPGTVRRTVVVIKKLEAMAEASIRPPVSEHRPDFASSFNSIRRVAYRPFAKRNIPQDTGVSGAPIKASGNTEEPQPPQPPATYKSFLKRPGRDSNRPRKRIKIGEWIDQNLVFFPNLQQRGMLPKPAQGTVSEVSRGRPVVNTTDDGWITAPQTQKISKRLRKSGKSIRGAVVKGWGKAYVFGSSVGSVVTSKVSWQRAVAIDHNLQTQQTMQETVRTVTMEEHIPVAGDGPEADDASEISHRADEILEAEPVQVENAEERRVVECNNN